MYFRILPTPWNTLLDSFHPLSVWSNLWKVPKYLPVFCQFCPVDAEENQNELAEEEFAAQFRENVEHIVSFRPTAASNMTEYSYNNMITAENGEIVDQIWAGPSHWKLKCIRASSKDGFGSYGNSRDVIIDLVDYWNMSRWSIMSLKISTTNISSRYSNTPYTQLMNT